MTKLPKKTTNNETLSDSLPGSAGTSLVALNTSLISLTPLGLPNQLGGYATAPIDRGDEVQDRFRYQWAIGAMLLADGISERSSFKAIWCEHHDDFLMELDSGKYVAIQVKTGSQENAKTRLNSPNFLNSIKRFCDHESSYGQSIEEYQFCSNVQVYVPGASAIKPSSLVDSPFRIIQACKNAYQVDLMEEPYKSKFKEIANKLEVDPTILFTVFRKLSFLEGPPLRGYLDKLIAQVIPKLPACADLPNKSLQKICEELMRLVETASGISTNGVNGTLDYILSNGRPANNIRGKCITLEAAKLSIVQAKEITFKYVGCGESLLSVAVEGQKSILHQKMRNAYLEGQFEPMWIRALSAERKLLEQAYLDPEGFEAMARQLEGAVLTECKDIEAMVALEPDEKKRGLKIYQQIISRLTEIAKDEPAKAQSEPKDTLIGVAGILSGSCKFAWGVPLKEDKNGS